MEQANVEQERKTQMKCPYCGTENSEKDIYCGECGRPIEEQKVKHKQFPAWGIAMGVIAAVLVGGCLGYVFRGYFGEAQTDTNVEEVRNVEDEQEDYNDVVSGATIDSLPETDKIWKEDESSGSGREDNEQANRSTNSEADTEADTEFASGVYIFPQSDKAYLTDKDIADLSLKEINYAKNEIYARHGRKFRSEELQRYFNSQEWYEALYEPEDFDANYSSRMLNDYEKENAKFLSEKEHSISPDGYELDR